MGLGSRRLPRSPDCRKLVLNMARPDQRLRSAPRPQGTHAFTLCAAEPSDGNATLLLPASRPFPEPVPEGKAAESPFGRASKDYSRFDVFA